MLDNLLSDLKSKCESLKLDFVSDTAIYNYCLNKPITSFTIKFTKGCFFYLWISGEVYSRSICFYIVGKHGDRICLLFGDEKPNKAKQQYDTIIKTIVQNIYKVA